MEENGEEGAKRGQRERFFAWALDSPLWSHRDYGRSPVHAYSGRLASRRLTRNGAIMGSSNRHHARRRHPRNYYFGRARPTGEENNSRRRQ